MHNGNTITHSAMECSSQFLSHVYFTRENEIKYQIYVYIEILLISLNVSFWMWSNKSVWNEIEKLISKHTNQNMSQDSRTVILGTWPRSNLTKSEINIINLLILIGKLVISEYGNIKTQLIVLDNEIAARKLSWNIMPSFEYTLILICICISISQMYTNIFVMLYNPS